MTVFYQETDLNLTVPISRDLSNATIRVHNEKAQDRNVCTDMEDFSSTDIEKFLYSAKHSLTTISDPSVIGEANEILDTIEKVLNLFNCADADIHRLPPLRPSKYDDGSIVFEIILSDFRVGFSVSLDRNNSGWYIVTKPNLGSVNAEGYFKNIDLRKTITWLLSYVLINS